MKCTKCGNDILEGEQVCRSCGQAVAPVENENTQEPVGMPSMTPPTGLEAQAPTTPPPAEAIPELQSFPTAPSFQGIPETTQAPTEPVQGLQNQVPTTNQTPGPVTVPHVDAQPKPKNSILKIVLIVFLVGTVVFGGIIALVVTLLVKASDSYDKLVCTSKTASITLMYDDEMLKGFSERGNISFDFDEQQPLSKELGIDNYLLQFRDKFESELDGTCVIEAAKK